MPGAPTLLRIAMLGTRGVPASYSGFETCAEELGGRLAARGHARPTYEASRIKGAQRRRLAMRPGMTGLWQVTGRNTVDLGG